MKLWWRRRQKENGNRDTNDDVSQDQPLRTTHFLSSVYPVTFLFFLSPSLNFALLLSLLCDLLFLVKKRLPGIINWNVWAGGRLCACRRSLVSLPRPIPCYYCHYGKYQSQLDTFCIIICSATLTVKGLDGQIWIFIFIYSLFFLGGGGRGEVFFGRLIFTYLCLSYYYGHLVIYFCNQCRTCLPLD